MFYHDVTGVYLLTKSNPTLGHYEKHIDPYKIGKLETNLGGVRPLYLRVMKKTQNFSFSSICFLILFWFFWISIRLDFGIEPIKIKKNKKKWIWFLIFFDFFCFFFLRLVASPTLMKKSNWNPIEIQKNPIEIQLKSKKIQKKSKKIEKNRKKSNWNRKKIQKNRKQSKKQSKKIKKKSKKNQKQIEKKSKRNRKKIEKKIQNIFDFFGVIFRV